MHLLEAASLGRMIRPSWQARRRLCSVGAATLALALMSSPTVAQTAANAEEADAANRDIVVTAQRREQRLQDVGVAVSAMSGESLRELGLTKATDIAQITPGVYVSGSYGGQSQQFTVRGVTQTDFSDSTETPVAVYIDDVYVATQQGHSLAVFDLDRVEVLKGPQGTLFGRNATGGLVSTVISKPKIGRTEGYIDLGYARFNEVKAEGAINLPVSDKAAVRVAGYYNRIDNFWKNRFPSGGLVAGAPTTFGPTALTPRGQDLGGSRTYAGRAQILLEPTDDLTIRLSASGAKSKLSASPYTSVASIGTYDAQGRLIATDRASPTETRLAIGPDGGNYANFAVIPFAQFSFPTGSRSPGANWFGYVPLDAKDLELSADAAAKRSNSASVWSIAGYVDYSLGDIDIASITAYQHHKKLFFLDADGGPTNFVVVPAKSQTKAFSQELRVSGGAEGFRWTTGAYYLNINNDSAGGLIGPPSSALAVVLGRAAQGADAARVSTLDTRSVSAFAQAEIGLVDKWTLVVGGRIINERQKYDLLRNVYTYDGDYQFNPTTVIFAFQPPYADKRSFTLWAGKVQLEYRPVDRMLIYAGVNRGVKGGNYNGPGFGTVLTDDQLSYNSETLINYETGFKFGDRNFALNAAAYYYDYQDYQAFLFTNASGYVQNVDMKQYGFDADIGMQVTPELRATLGASYNHSSIKNFEIAPGILRTVRPTYAPRKQGTAQLTYTVPAKIVSGELKLNALASYTSGIYHNLRNFDASWFKGRTIANFSATWQQDNGGLRVTAYLNNAFDKRYGQIGFENTAICGCNLESYGTPQTYGLTVGYRF
ncbi:TonB-dependent receptor [Rhizorhabdus wittichii]|uniref:TonB-dependent receptor n=1 Tax=Rhizorhabdus wittichii TaxID=160791 RepID=UPI0009D9452F|nr:TonB-dependent receptor [Rhizorhabdus wittichii]